MTFPGLTGIRCALWWHMRASNPLAPRLYGSAGGFTLLELIVVLAIVAAVAAFALPSFSPGAGVQLKTATRALMVGLRQTRSEAIATNVSKALVLDLEERHFKVGDSSRVRHLPSDVGVSLFTASRERVDERTGGIRFFPDGSSTGGRVTLTSGNRELFVDVDWLTGRIRLLDPSDDQG